MSRPDIDRFRLRCRQFRWLAIFMVATVGALLALMYLPRRRCCWPVASIWSRPGNG